jgi:zinc transport system ATP-binding protein
MPLTVSEFLAMGFQKKPLWLGIHPKLQNRSREALTLVKAEHLAGRKIGALSGGEIAAGAPGLGPATGTRSPGPR